MSVNVLLNGETYNGVESITLPASGNATQEFVLPEDAISSIGGFSRYSTRSLVAGTDFAPDHDNFAAIINDLGVAPKLLRMTTEDDTGAKKIVIDFIANIGVYYGYNAANSGWSSGGITPAKGTTVSNGLFMASNSQIKFALATPNVKFNDGVEYTVELYA